MTDGDSVCDDDGEYCGPFVMWLSLRFLLRYSDILEAESLVCWGSFSRSLCVLFRSGSIQRMPVGL